MRLFKTQDNLKITNTLRMGKNSTMKVDQSDGTTTTLDIAELAALDDISATELGFVNGVTAGTVTASKAVVVDANKDVGDLRNLDCVNLDAGASGTAGSVDVFPTTASKGKLIVSATDNTNDDAVTITNAAHGQATTVTIPDGGAATTYVVQSTAALTLAEADFLDGATAGTQVASKAVIADSNVNTGISKVTELHIGASGSETQVTSTAAELNQLDGNLMAALATGAGTGITGGTGTIYASSVLKAGDFYHTRILIDLTGLDSDATLGDIIGVSATTNPCHLGQVTAAESGTVAFGQVSCLETPAGGEVDIDLYSADEATGITDGAIGSLTNSTALMAAATDWTAGTQITFTDIPAANQHLYLTTGTSSTPTAGTYTAGKFLIEMWGT